MAVVPLSESCLADISLKWIEKQKSTENWNTYCHRNNVVNSDECRAFLWLLFLGFHWVFTPTHVSKAKADKWADLHIWQEITCQIKIKFGKWKKCNVSKSNKSIKKRMKLKQEKNVKLCGHCKKGKNLWAADKRGAHLTFTPWSFLRVWISPAVMSNKRLLPFMLGVKLTPGNKTFQTWLPFNWNN